MYVNKLRILRLQKGVTQRQCSDDTGISVRTLQRYEQGHEIGDPKYLKILSAYYGVPVSELLDLCCEK